MVPRRRFVEQAVNTTLTLKAGLSSSCFTHPQTYDFAIAEMRGVACMEIVSMRR
jgi:hypothetical protein